MMTEKELEKRFNILRTKYYMPGFLRITSSKRTQEVSIRNQLGELGYMLKIYTRGKVTDVKYYITDIGITESNI